MSDDIKNIKIGGISAGEYIRGVKNGNIDPSFDNAVKAILWAADEIERLRAAKSPISQFSDGELRNELHRRAQHFLGDQTKGISFPLEG